MSSIGVSELAIVCVILAILLAVIAGGIALVVTLARKNKE